MSAEPARAPATPWGLWARLTATQLTAATAVLAALALTASLVLTGLAVRADQREKAALAALQDYAAMIAKLGAEETFTAHTLNAGDLIWLETWLEAFQARPGQAAALNADCRAGRGGAGVRLIQAPGLAPAGAAALADAPAEPLERLGQGVVALDLPRGTLCPNRDVEVVAVRQAYGGLTVTAGRVVEQPGAAWGWAALAVLGMGAVILASGFAAAALARRRMTAALTRLSQTLDRAAVGDFSHRAPETGGAPELGVLSRQVNQTLDRLETLLSWLRDSADQMAHDFRTPLARASARLDQLTAAADAATRARLTREAGEDLASLSRAMTEAIALRDGEAWAFETLRLDALAEATADLYGAVAEERGVTLRVDAASVEVLGVRSLLLRAAANLVDNAIKFSPSDGVVTLSVSRRDGGALFVVADQGPGVDPAALDDPARRGGQGRESHGMGLPFVRAVMRRHGGDMIIDDGAPGAVVTLRFRG